MNQDCEVSICFCGEYAVRLLGDKEVCEQYPFCEKHI